MIKIGKVEGDVIENGGVKNQTIVQGGSPTIINSKEGQSNENAKSVNAASPTVTNRINRPKLLAEEIQSLIDEGMISIAYDFCIIYKLDQEIPLVGFVSQKDFLERLPKLMAKPIPEKLMPNENHFKNLSLGSRPYPHWSFSNNSNQIHFTALANAFIQDMQAKGFIHPSLVQPEEAK